jgi:CrcB protein
MALSAVAAVFVGAGCGAVLRWWLGLLLNPLFTSPPLGTLTANLVGGYLVGVAAVLFSLKTGLAPELRLLVITGFLGGLTTFSTFSAEVVAELLHGRPSAAAAAIALHLLGSLGLTLAGMWSGRWLFG